MSTQAEADARNAAFRSGCGIYAACDLDLDAGEDAQRDAGSADAGADACADATAACPSTLPTAGSPIACCPSSTQTCGYDLAPGACATCVCGADGTWKCTLLSDDACGLPGRDGGDAGAEDASMGDDADAPTDSAAEVDPDGSADDASDGAEGGATTLPDGLWCPAGGTTPADHGGILICPNGDIAVGDTGHDLLCGAGCARTGPASFSCTALQNGQLKTFEYEWQVVGGQQEVCATPVGGSTQCFVVTPCTGVTCDQRNVPPYC